MKIRREKIFFNFWGMTVIMLMVSGFQNCSRVSFLAASDNESMALGREDVFDIHRRVDGVMGADGYPSENLRVATAGEASRFLVQDCSAPVKLSSGKEMDRYEYEKESALLTAENDPERRTIPVHYAMSFGTANDRLAKWAHERAVLSMGSGDISRIPVGDKRGSVYSLNGKSMDAYYEADHTKAREDYIFGRRCFFNTVKIQGPLKAVPRAGAVRYDFLSGESAGNAHMIHYMYFGYCAEATQKCASDSSPYGAGAYGADGYPNRLFSAWPHTENGRPQIVKLYVADLRDRQFGLNEPVVLAEEGRVRGVEMKFDTRRELNLRALFRNREQVVRHLSTRFSYQGLVFSGLRGVPQLLTNLLGASGYSLASQYTPIVLDLGAEKVKTSSRFGGTYFNMAARVKRGPAGAESLDVPHQTAWLGGDLVDTLSPAPANVEKFKADFRREAEDGFLVIPDADGQVRSSRNLFGDQTLVNGQRFPDGFAALRALSGKDCASEDPKRRYFGPWDGKLYSSVIRVWIDKNRNGVAEKEELKGLKDVGMVALNTCYVRHAEGLDAFGNGTAMRSAFLFQEEEDITGDEKEILDRLKTGRKSDGHDARFRLAIDLIFQTDPDQTLEALE